MIKRYFTALLAVVVIINIVTINANAAFSVEAGVKGIIPKEEAPVKSKYGACNAEFDVDFLNFMATHGLNDKNFAMAYYNTVTGETISFNESAWFVGGSIYKLPLNMALTDAIADGTYSKTDKLMGYTLSDVQYYSIVYSNNPLSEALQRKIGNNNYSSYRKTISKYFGVEGLENDTAFLSKNTFSATCMINTLKYLYANKEKYSTIIDYMKIAAPNQYFKAGVTQCEIAHKYGAIDRVVNDVGIFYTDSPFLLVVLTDGVSGKNWSKITDLTAKFMYEYNNAPKENVPQNSSNDEVFSGSFDSKTLFVGDSLTYHLVTKYLKPNGIIGEASYMAAPCTGLYHFFSDSWTLKPSAGNYYSCACNSEFNGLTFADAVSQSAGKYTKVYFLMGSNGSGSVTKEAYEQVVDHLIFSYPEATIYLQSVPNCTTGTVNSKRVNSCVADTVNAYNEKGVANVVLLDTNSIWDSTCIAGDGVHLTDEGLKKWTEYIIANT